MNSVGKVSRIILCLESALCEDITLKLSMYVTTKVTFIIMYRYESETLFDLCTILESIVDMIVLLYLHASADVL